MRGTERSQALESAQEAKAAAQAEAERFAPTATSSLESKQAQAEERLAVLAGGIERGIPRSAILRWRRQQLPGRKSAELYVDVLKG